MPCVASGVIAAAVAGPAVAAVAVGVGVGVLVVGGVMWMGEKIQENYEDACNRWTAQKEATRNTATVSNLPDLLAMQLEQAAVNSTNLVLGPSISPSSSPQVDAKSEREVAAALAKARAVIESGQDIANLRAQNERALLVQRVKMEIAACQGVLPATHIALAEAALRGNVQQLRQALTSLQQAMRSVSDAGLQRQLQERQAALAIQATTGQLQALAVLVRESGNRLYAQRQQDITQRLEQARQSPSAQALTLATTLQGEIQALSRTISQEMLQAWEATRREVVQFQGMLDTLSTMTKEAINLRLLDAAQSGSCSRNIEAAQKEAEALLQGRASDGPGRLKQLTERVDSLKKEVFDLTKKAQQARMAQTIATTLSEQGFDSFDGGTPPVQEFGAQARIRAIKVQTDSDGKRDDKVITFDVTRDGEFTYDCSGYVGEAALADIEKLFDALKAKGVYMLDSKSVEKLQQMPVEQITPVTLQQERFTPGKEQHKSQSEIAKQLLQLFTQLNYTITHQNTVGGYIELDATSGTTDYHIVLPPDGHVQVFKDQQDITSNEADPIVAEGKRLHKADEVSATKREQKKIKEAWRRPKTQQKRQALSQ